MPSKPGPRGHGPPAARGPFASPCWVSPLRSFSEPALPEASAPPPTATPATGPISVGPDGETSLGLESLASKLGAIPVGELDDAERAAIVYMREEEKLAYDVYQELYRLWGSGVFANISAAELTHMASVELLLSRYGIPDPAADTTAGEFVDPALQALYDELVAKGSLSLVDAFTVGATIEGLDIADLQQRESAQPDIALVFDNLELGSRNTCGRSTASWSGPVSRTGRPISVRSNSMRSSVLRRSAGPVLDQLEARCCTRSSAGTGLGRSRSTKKGPGPHAARPFVQERELA